MDKLLEYMAGQLPVLVILAPVCGALLCLAISRLCPQAGKLLVIISLLTSFLLACAQLYIVAKEGSPIYYSLGGWAAPYGIQLAIDGVSGIIVVLVSAIGTLTALYSSPFEPALKENWFKAGGYYVILAFLAIGLLGTTSAGDAFTLYVFVEITALAGYGLIAAGEEKGPIAAFRYLMTGTIGACMYLLGVGFLYAATGTLNMADLATRLAQLQDSPLVYMASACIIVGFGIKMALFPLHGWQPAAHSYAHPGADPMIAGVMIKVPAYAMIRFFFYIFQEQSQVIVWCREIVGIMAICGILFGSLKALRYDTYNKILAYSSIGQVGYIAMGISLGNYYGLVGAVLHILAHAMMKSGLFYTSGAVKYKYGIHETSQLGQVYRDMPLTSATMTVCMLSMIGLPPLAGFASKWYLALGAIEEGKYIYVVVLVLSSLLSAIYFFRFFEKLFMGEKVTTLKKKKDIPWQMLIPMAVVALGVICQGLFSAYLVENLFHTTLMEVFLQ